MNRLAPLFRLLLHDARSRPAWRVVLAVLVVIVAWFAFGPAEPLPELPGGDKLNHLLAFVALGTAASFGLPRGWLATAQVAAGLLLYGALIEAVQTQLPHRQGEWLDLAADCAGLFCGLILAEGMRRATAAAQFAESAKSGPD